MCVPREHKPFLIPQLKILGKYENSCQGRRSRSSVFWVHDNGYSY